MLGLKSARRAGLLSGTAMALVVAFGGSRAAFALDECSAGAPSGTVICTTAGNPYAAGIQYKVDDLTIVVEDGVVIDTTTKLGEPGGIVSGGAGDYGSLEITAGTNGGGVIIITDKADAVGISAATKDGGALIYAHGAITTSGAAASGIVAEAGAGDARVTWEGDIKTSGTTAHGISATSAAGAATINNEGTIDIGAGNTVGLLAVSSKYGSFITHVGSISTNNGNSIGAKAVSVTGSADIDITGEITTFGNDLHGAYAYSQSFVNVTVTGDVTTSGDGANALYAKVKDGTAFAKAYGTIVTKGDDAVGIEVVGLDAGGGAALLEGKIGTQGEAANGIKISTKDGNAGVVLNGGGISTTGENATGIHVVSTSGDVFVLGSGTLSVTGKQAEGLLAVTGGTGAIDIDLDAIIGTAGESGLGLLAESDSGKITVTFTGAVFTHGYSSAGIGLTSKSGDISRLIDGDVTTASGLGIGVNTDGAVIVEQTGDITVAGDDNEGISLFSEKSSVSLEQTGNITTTGKAGEGITAYAAGKVFITTSGAISTSGDDATGLAAFSKDYVLVLSLGTITTTGASASGINLSAQDNGKIALVVNDDVHTSGKTADAVVASAENGSVAMQVNGDIIATGEAAHGLTAISDNLTAIIVTSEVQGGWNGGNGVTIDGDGPALIGFESSAIVGALSDIAVTNGTGTFEASNLGAITGSADFGKGDDAFRNGGTWNLRSFKDVDGDQQRDKEFVALLDFAEDEDSFANKGVLRLASAADAADWDTTGQILHPGGGNSDITQEGIEQGFITGLETFTHSGLITLSDGVAGDLLVITDQADGKTKGGNVFKSDGGSLALDVVLDDGSSKQSDVLILDKAELGTGATQVLISNAGGFGGQTTGDGILVVNVRDKSDAAAFALGNRPVAGAYQYDLVYQNQAKTDENWYLQSSFFDGSLEYPAIVSGALETWHAALGSLHDQIRIRRALLEEQDTAGQTAELPTATDVADTSSVRVNDGGGNAGWFRVSGSDMDFEQSGPADFDLNTTRAEVGFDVGFDNLFGETGDWLVLGALAGYGWSSLGFEGGSNADFDIATIGAYATYFRGPYYLDALVKLDWFDGSFNSDLVSDDNDVSLPVFGLSLETGYRFDVTDGGLYLQPQAQLSYAHSGEDSFKDDSGSEIALQSADSLRGRLGVRLGQELNTTAGAAGEPVRGNFYLEASANQEFLGDAEARVSGLTLEQDLPGTTFEIGGGIDIALPKDGVTFTVDADYTLGNEAEGISATGGFRINW